MWNLKKKTKHNRERLIEHKPVIAMVGGGGAVKMSETGEGN